LASHNSDFFPQLSIVIPLLNEEASLQELSGQVIEALSGQYSFEIIFVDDGSEDGSWQTIKTIIQSQPQYQIRGIQLSRNYGKSTALQAGFNEAQGRYIATLDADLQDDPQEIPAMIAMLDEGYDMVSGWKKQRNDPLQKTIPSRFFNAVTAALTDIKLHDFNCGLKVYKRAVTDHIHLYGERHRYIPLLAKWEGYDRIGEKQVNHRPRKHGTTKFGLPRFMHGFLDLLTLKFVGRYHQRPMHFFGTLGFIFLVSGTGINLYLAAIKVLYGADLSNRPLLLLGLLLMVLGAQFFSIGFLGELFYKDRHEHDKPNIRDKI
jgi:glycosyltransferase involved in cell wall biosynthesis